MTGSRRWLSPYSTYSHEWWTVCIIPPVMGIDKLQNIYWIWPLKQIMTGTFVGDWPQATLYRQDIYGADPIALCLHYARRGPYITEPRSINATDIKKVLCLTYMSTAELLRLLFILSVHLQAGGRQFEEEGICYNKYICWNKTEDQEGKLPLEGCFWCKILSMLGKNKQRKKRVWVDQLNRE